ncbi:hypothetical protein [Sellimonas caecigallum]|nr:hypothetical protein [Sellimonas caecigallum]
MKNYKFNDDIPAGEAIHYIRAVERYVNTTRIVDENVILAILGIEKVEEK